LQFTRNHRTDAGNLLEFERRVKGTLRSRLDDPLRPDGTDPWQHLERIRVSGIQIQFLSEQ